MIAMHRENVAFSLQALPVFAYIDVFPFSAQWEACPGPRTGAEIGDASASICIYRACRSSGTRPERVHVPESACHRPAEDDL